MMDGDYFHLSSVNKALALQLQLANCCRTAFVSSFTSFDIRANSSFVTEEVAAVRGDDAVDRWQWAATQPRPTPCLGAAAAGFKVEKGQKNNFC